MKLLFNTLILLMTNFGYSQIISGRIVDSISKKTIDLATISFKNLSYNVLSDTEGNFKIDCNNASSALLISNIGYKTKQVKISNKQNYYIIYLSPQIEELNEVIIVSKNKKIEYSWDKILKSKNENSEHVGFQFNTENCVYIKNPYNKKGKIKSISFEVSKLKGYLDNKKYKIDYLATFNMKFYSYDNQRQKPGKEIYSKNLIIETENKTYNLTIDIDSLQIPFPENGVCIGVEIINTKYKNPKTTFAYIGPIMNFYKNTELSPANSWIRYRNDEKNDFMTPVFQDLKGKKYYTPIIDLIINIEK
jgi:hypothetical protein